MTIIDLTKDLDNHTLTIVSEYPASVERVWSMWADPRNLERWFGPPTHPATFTEHDLTAGGVSRYYMTGPEGERYSGGWEVIRVDAPRELEYEDYFADDDGNEVPDMPRSRTVVTFEEIADGGTRMSSVTSYASAEALAQVLEMGIEEGIRAAYPQLDALLAEGR